MTKCRNAYTQLNAFYSFAHPLSFHAIGFQYSFTPKVISTKHVVLIASLYAVSGHWITKMACNVIQNQVQVDID